jgi:hypothetical protein
MTNRSGQDPVRLMFDGTSVDWDGRVSNLEAMQIQKVTGMRYGDFLAGTATVDPVAMTALVWLCRRRAGEPNLRYSEVEFDMVSFDFAPLDGDGNLVEPEPDAVATRRALVDLAGELRAAGYADAAGQVEAAAELVPQPDPAAAVVVDAEGNEEGRGSSGPTT